MIGMMNFHLILLRVTIISRRNINFQLILSALTCECYFATIAFYLAFRLLSNRLQNVCIIVSYQLEYHTIPTIIIDISVLVTEISSYISIVPHVRLNPSN
jgi:hypothetical protein